MTENVTTVATQAFQIWLNEDLQEIGWDMPPVTLSAFAKPFDTWSDMGQVIPAEGWRFSPVTVAYFCGALPDSPPGAPALSLEASRRIVRDNAVAFLDTEVRHLWPNAADIAGGFRWDLLVTADEASGPPPSSAGAATPATVSTANSGPPMSIPATDTRSHCLERSNTGYLRWTTLMTT